MKKLIGFLLLSVAAFGQSVSFPGPGSPASSAVIPYLYYGPGCVGTSTKTCTVANTAYNFQAGYTAGASFTTGANAAGYTATHCGFYANAGTTAHWRCAIYKSGSPATLVTNCNQTSDNSLVATPSWQESAMPAGCMLAASTLYFVQFEFSGSGQTRYQSASSGGGYIGMAYGAWATSPTIIGTAFYSSYAKVTAN
jgi:hypothetical protein